MQIPNDSKRWWSFFFVQKKSANDNTRHAACARTQGREIVRGLKAAAAASEARECPFRENLFFPSFPFLLLAWMGECATVLTASLLLLLFYERTHVWTYVPCTYIVVLCPYKSVDVAAGSNLDPFLLSPLFFHVRFPKILLLLNCEGVDHFARSGTENKFQQRISGLVLIIFVPGIRMKRSYIDLWRH